MTFQALAAFVTSSSSGAYGARIAALPLYAAVGAFYMVDAYRRKRDKEMNSAAFICWWAKDRDEKMRVVREALDKEPAQLTFKRAYHVVSPVQGEQDKPFHDGRYWRLVDTCVAPLVLAALPFGLGLSIMWSMMILPHATWSFARDDAKLIVDKAREQ